MTTKEIENSKKKSLVNDSGSNDKHVVVDRYVIYDYTNQKKNEAYAAKRNVLLPGIHR